MTRSKTELAIILIKLRGEVTDPKEVEKEAAKLASEMSLMKLCYEIQKVEEMTHSDEPQASPSVQPEASPTVELTKKEEEIVEELKVPEKISKEKRHKHILSWLLDSSSEDETD